MRIVLTGASGLIGHELSSLLRGEGHETIALVRHRTQAENEVYWDPAVRLIDSAPLAGVNAVIHLAGRKHRRRTLDACAQARNQKQSGRRHSLAL